MRRKKELDSNVNSRIDYPDIDLSNYKILELDHPPTMSEGSVITRGYCGWELKKCISVFESMYGEIEGEIATYKDSSGVFHVRIPYTDKRNGEARENNN